MKKLVLSLDVHDDTKCKQKVMKIVSSVQGIDDISLDVKEKKLTLIGTMDMVEVVKKLRKVYHTTVVSIGPPKEPQKPKEKPNKEEPNIPEARPHIVYVDPWRWPCL